ncbi:hypothetical protein ACQ86N_28425 [Puia sp. P3]|uniref:hypothetical protein n=1 Tax=Puia sp. P3 TaxID=3423952 RepID=UPI003D66F2FB
MTRPVTSAMTTWDKEWEMYDPLFAVQDIGGYNYQLFRAASDHARVPSRIIVQTESYPRDAFANWKILRDNSYVIGDFVWTAMDYLGEAAIGKTTIPARPGGILAVGAVSVAWSLLRGPGYHGMAEAGVSLPEYIEQWRRQRGRIR